MELQRQLGDLQKVAAFSGALGMQRQMEEMRTVLASSGALGMQRQAQALQKAIDPSTITEMRRSMRHAARASALVRNNLQEIVGPDVLVQSGELPFSPTPTPSEGEEPVTTPPAPLTPTEPATSEEWWFGEEVLIGLLISIRNRRQDYTGEAVHAREAVALPPSELMGWGLVCIEFAFEVRDPALRSLLGAMGGSLVIAAFARWNADSAPAG